MHWEYLSLCWSSFVWRCMQEVDMALLWSRTCTSSYMRDLFQVLKRTIRYVQDDSFSPSQRMPLWPAAPCSVPRRTKRVLFSTWCVANLTLVQGDQKDSAPFVLNDVTRLKCLYCLLQSRDVLMCTTILLPSTNDRGLRCFENVKLMLSASLRMRKTDNWFTGTSPRLIMTSNIDG